MANGADLSRAFAAALGGDGAYGEPAPAALLGLEHEYQLSRDGRRLDFRDLIHTLDVPGRRLDPGDANAYRLSSGLALTCDDAEAEVATPPLNVRPGFSLAVDGWAAAGLAELRRVLPHDVEAGGFSTHLSASLPDDDALDVLRLFAGAFAPVVMLLLDGPEGRGVYVRPRPGRIELCGDYATGAYLRAASVFFAGGVRACAAALSGNGAASPRPPLLAIRLRPATGRYGAYVGRRLALGFDLYGAGRRARLPLAAGGETEAQTQLSLAWEAARHHLAGDASTDDVAIVDAIVAGDLPLGVEAGPAPLGHQPAAPPAPHALGSVVEAVSRPAFVVEAVIATWDFTVFRVTGRRQAFASVPRDAIGPFLQRLSSGGLDAAIEVYLASPSVGRRLMRNEQTHAAGLWDDVASGLQLLAPERDPSTGIPASAGDDLAPDPDPADQRSGKPAAARAGKPGGPPSEAVVGRPGKEGAPPFEAAEGRPGKPPTVVARPGKPLVLPPRPAEAAPSPPMLPVPIVPPLPPVPLPPAQPPAPLPEPPAPPPRPGWLVPAGVVAGVVGVVVVAAALMDVFDGGAPPTTETPTATVSPTVSATPRATETPRTPTGTPTPRPTEVGPIGAGPTATPRPLDPTSAPPTATRVIETLTPVPTPTCTPPQPGIVGTCTPTPTPSPSTTPTPSVTTTPTPTATCIPPGAGTAGNCTPTPTLTPTLTAVP